MTTPLFKRPQNMTGFNDFMIQHTNNVYLAGTMGIWIDVMLFTIIFVSLLPFGARRAFSAASAVVFVVTTLMVPLGLAGVTLWATSVVMLVTAIVFAKDTEGGAIR